ncbi:MAG: phospholipid carrier-dependent glycosyltransferase [Candidatus Schekmanbacteria bacterium]|nr:phospholipid carrier-dependent glycosyltransferase [Candidatus Schekmanbacteria bacterium]
MINSLSKKRFSFLIILVFIIFYIMPLGVRPLFIKDETRYGEIPREMISTDEWIVPHLNGLRYFEKPVLGYWLNAGSILLFGENNFAVRFPSAMATGLSALLIFLMLKKSVKESIEEANTAAIIFLTCFAVFGIGTFSILDNMFVFFLTGMMMTFYLASDSENDLWRQRTLLAASGIFCGLAFLTKGFLAVALPALVIVPWLIWQGRWKDILRFSWLPLVVSILVVLPWSILVNIKEPDFWNFFFWEQHVRRFIGHDAQHKRNFGFFLLTMPAMFLPWTFMIPAASSSIREKIGEESQIGNLTRFCFCWFLFPFLLFSVSKSKLLTYILPCFPPLAILMSLGLLNTLKKGKNKNFQSGAAVSSIIFSLILIALFYLQFYGYKGFYPYSKTWEWVLLESAVIFMILFCSLSLRKLKSAGDKVLLFSLAPLLLLFSYPFIIPDMVIKEQALGSFLESHKDDVLPGTLILSDESPVTAVCWYYKRDNVYLIENEGELGYGLEYNDAKHKALKKADASLLINKNRGNVVLVASAGNYKRWKKRLPKPESEDYYDVDGYVFVKY